MQLFSPSPDECIEFKKLVKIDPILIDEFAIKKHEMKMLVNCETLPRENKS